MPMLCSRHVTISVSFTLNADMRARSLLLTATAPWTLVSARGPVVDLDYEAYEGYYNGSYDLNIWKGYVKVCLMSYQ